MERETIDLRPRGVDFDHGPKLHKSIGFGDIHGPKPYKFIGFEVSPVVALRWGSGPDGLEDLAGTG